MIRDDLVREHRARALNPEHPFIRGTAHNPDTYFQAREGVQYVLPARSRASFRQPWTALDGCLAGPIGCSNTKAHPTPSASSSSWLGSGDRSNRPRGAGAPLGEKVGVLQVRLYRPFSSPDFLAAIPSTVRSVAVLESDQGAGLHGEPLYLDVITTPRAGHRLRRAPSYASCDRRPLRDRVEGLYPAMVKATFDENEQPRGRTVSPSGSADDIST